MPESLEAFEQQLDIELQELNSDYQAKRYNNFILRNLKIKAVPSQTFYNWLKSQNKLGGQNKVPRLSNSSKYIDELMKFSG